MKLLAAFAQNWQQTAGQFEPNRILASTKRSRCMWKAETKAHRGPAIKGIRPSEVPVLNGNYRRDRLE